jgi:hypothetical protein
MNIQAFETSIEHFGQAFMSFLKGVTHFVVVASPIAEIVGAAVGQPEVVAGAKLAEVAAGAAEVVLTAETAVSKPAS